MSDLTTAGTTNYYQQALNAGVRWNRWPIYWGDVVKHGGYSRKATILPGEDPQAFDEMTRWHFSQENWIVPVGSMARSPCGSRVQGLDRT